MIEELQSAVLTRDLPDKGLKEGDVGTVVLVLQGGSGYAVEFMTFAGETLAVVTVLADAVRPVREGEIPHARTVARGP